MTEVRFLPPAAKFIKKIKDKKFNVPYQNAVDMIHKNPAQSIYKPGI